MAGWPKPGIIAQMALRAYPDDITLICQINCINGWNYLISSD